MKIDDIAKQLANRVNQEKYIKHLLNKMTVQAYNIGFQDGQRQFKNNALLHNVSGSLCSNFVARDDFSSGICKNCGYIH